MVTMLLNIMAALSVTGAAVALALAVYAVRRLREIEKAGYIVRRLREMEKAGYVVRRLREIEKAAGGQPAERAPGSPQTSLAHQTPAPATPREPVGPNSPVSPDEPGWRRWPKVGEANLRGLSPLQRVSRILGADYPHDHIHFSTEHDGAQRVSVTVSGGPYSGWSEEYIVTLAPLERREDYLFQVAFLGKEDGAEPKGRVVALVADEYAVIALIRELREMAAVEESEL